MFFDDCEWLILLIYQIHSCWSYDKACSSLGLAASKIVTKYYVPRLSVFTVIRTNLFLASTVSRRLCVTEPLSSRSSNEPSTAEQC